MDAITLLHEVAATYRNLQTLTLTATLIQESGDEEANQRSQRRVHFAYAAPDRMRCQTGGPMGVLTVADGKDLHTCFGRPFNGPRYHSVPISETGPLPHLFQPEFASSGETFLFPEIDQFVVRSEILREEDGCQVVSVSYPPPPHQSLFTGDSVLFWIDPLSHMVMRYQGRMGHRMPMRDRVTWSNHTVVLREFRLNPELEDDTFRFVPPPGSQPEDFTGSAGWIGGGSGFSRHSGDPKQHLEFQGSHNWEGDVLVEHGKWKMRGIQFDLERRFEFSDDEKELRVTEKITGPQGNAEMSCKLPVA
jgi:hypothetical protein